MNPYLYEAKDTIIHRLDPRVKIFLMAASFFVMLLPSHLPLAFASFTIIGIHATLAKAWDTIGRLWKFLLIITIFTVGIWSLIPRGDEMLWLFVRRDAVLFGLLTAVKIVGILMRRSDLSSWEFPMPPASLFRWRSGWCRHSRKRV
jgi:energy-coupling factor transport system permease protein